MQDLLPQSRWSSKEIWSLPPFYRTRGGISYRAKPPASRELIQMAVLHVCLRLVPASPWQELLCQPKPRKARAGCQLLCLAHSLSTTPCCLACRELGQTVAGEGGKNDLTERASPRHAWVRSLQLGKGGGKTQW